VVVVVVGLMETTAMGPETPAVMAVVVVGGSATVLVVLLQQHKDTKVD
jgi:hypothetical protein